MKPLTRRDFLKTSTAGTLLAAMPATAVPAQSAPCADGLCTWDGERRTARISEWTAVRRLGHVAQLDRLAAEGPSFYRGVKLKHLGGFDARWSFKDG